MTTNIVSMLLEGGMTAEIPESLTVTEAEQYTLESGATLIARQSVQELHEIFEVAIVETNEAALAAYMEGNQDVMESATYGPVFEAAEKSVTQKVITFLRKLKDRVMAFFQNIFSKIMLMVNGYEKFYEKHKEELAKAKPVKDVPCMDWSDDKIETLGASTKGMAETVKEVGNVLVNKIDKIMNETRPQWKNKYAKELDRDLLTHMNNSAKNMGIARSTGAGELDLTQINKDLNLLFVKPNKVKKNIDASYVADILKDTKNAAKEVKDAQKAFNAAYDDAIKTIESITKDMDKEKASGYAQYIHKTTAHMSKMQTLLNAYISCGYRALIGRANESKALAKIIISGKVPKEKDNK